MTASTRLHGDGHEAVPDTTFEYRGWSCWYTAGGSWAATDGRYNASGAAPFSAYQTAEDLMSKIDEYVSRPVR